MENFIFFYPTKYYLGGQCLVNTLVLTLAAKADEQTDRYRECCVEHVRFWEESTTN